MESSPDPIPTDDDVRRLLSGARFTPDPRALAAVTLLLSLGLSLGVVRQLRWHCLDIKSQTLRTRSSRVGTNPVTITKLLIRQLLAIPHSNSSDRIFGKYRTESPSIDLLLRRTLISSGLSMYRWSDFVRWSGLQTAAIRLSVATP
jgi:integrase